MLLIAPAAAADDYNELGAFERETVDAVLADNGLVVEPKPEGKTIGRILVVNSEVFSKKDGFLSWFNIFHWTTKKHVIEREVLLRPGMKWDKELADESIRRIRDPILSNIVVLLAIKTADPKVVDLLVVTRDVWSLRLNSDFQIQDGDLTFLTLSLAENNFLGLRKKTAVTFLMDQGAFSIGPRYTDSNIAGTRLTLSTAANAIFSRETGEFEGSASSTSFAYPLWSLATPFGASISVAHNDSVQRGYRGSAQQYEYRYSAFDVTASATYSTGTTWKKRFSFGYEYFANDAELHFVDPGFGRGVLPRVERSSGVFVKWRFFTPRYQTYRDFRTFDLREDYRLGPEFTFRIGQALQSLGSTSDYTTMAAVLEYTFDPGSRSYVQLYGGFSVRLQHDNAVESRVEAKVYVGTPTLWNALRVVARVDMDARFNETANRFFSLGGSNGLRGHDIGALTGERRLRANVELRTRPLRWYFFRLGGVAFYDAGGAADDFDDLHILHDVGIGLRILTPQVNPFAFRIDWAFATEGATAGWPGRFSAGFFQAF